MEQTDSLLSRTLAFCAVLQKSRLNVTQGRVIDVCRSLRSINLLYEDEVRWAMRANLVSSPEEGVLFDRLFDAYWHPQNTPEGDRVMFQTEFVPGQVDQGFFEGHTEIVGSPYQFSPEHVARDSALDQRWDDEAPALDQIIRDLAKKLATRPSRRMQSARHDGRMNLRGALRKNARYGLDMLELAHVQRRVRKIRLVMLCDVSGSMDAFNPFLLQLMFGLQKELKNSRTLVFSTQVTEITSLLRRHSVQQTLREIGKQVRHWSGGTDIGHALMSLNCGILREGSARSTVALIISDGYDTGDPEAIAREMRALRRRVRTVVWVNPMFGSQTFQPRAQGMKAALPFIDHFLPAFNVQSLKVLVRELGQV